MVFEIMRNERKNFRPNSLAGNVEVKLRKCFWFKTHFTFKVNIFVIRKLVS